MDHLGLDYSHPTENQEIVQIIGNGDKRLHRAETIDGKRFTVSSSALACANISIGQFVIIERTTASVIRGNIVRILTDFHIRNFFLNDIWPIKFLTNGVRRVLLLMDDSSEDESSDSDYFGSSADDSDASVETIPFPNLYDHIALDNSDSEDSSDAASDSDSNEECFNQDQFSTDNDSEMDEENDADVDTDNDC